MRLFAFSGRSASGAVALGLALSAAPVARADGVVPADATADQKKLALDHFQAGKRALETNALEKALFELRASLDAVDSPNARLVLARALRDGGQLDKARIEYLRVVDGATKLAVKEPRYKATADAAGSERADVDTKLAFLTVKIPHAPPDATLHVAGHVVPRADWASPVVTSPGAVDIVLVDAKGVELARQTVDAPAGQAAIVTFDAPIAETPSAPLPVAPAVPGTGSEGAGLRTYAYVSGGVGVAGLAAFTIFGLMSNSDYNDLSKSCTPATGSGGGQTCPASKSGEISSGQTDQTLANVGLAVGIAGVATAATLLVLSLTGHSSPTTGLLVGPGYVGLQGAL